MDYYHKYIKYKSKYIKYKNHLGEATKEDNIFILHGTNLYYINDIKRNGLTGKYNEILYSIIQKYWPTIRYLSNDHYVDYFIERQNNFKKNIVSLSFTGQYIVAREYSVGPRKCGEGPSRFLRVFSEYINKNISNISDEMMNDYNSINETSKYPGIILAININDFRDKQIIKNLQIDDLNYWKLALNFEIPADKLYIRKENKEYILLVSEDGDEYLKIKDEERNKLLEEEKIKLLEEEKIKLLEERNKLLEK